MGDTKKYMVDGYLPTIGIECHVQLKTKTKLFTSVSNEARRVEPNTLIGHVCFGMPGALPVLNEEAVRLSAKAAFALGTSPQKFSKFDRKHYFYPDLPKGYQITQFEEPIILGGELEIQLEDGSQKVVNITRAHIEEDAGKSTHPAGTDYSLVDLNRAGTPLLEIVSEPEMHSSAEAKAFAKELWLRMKYSGVSDVDLYHGNMRFDVNVSVNKDASKLGIRSETKNLNSFKSVERAVDYEVKRQISLLEGGGEVAQETRGWLDDKQKTVSQRSKEDSHDYRYFPDPDIPPVILDDAYIRKLKESLPIMPKEWRSKLSSIGIDKLTVETMLGANNGPRYLGIVNESSKKPKDAVWLANWYVNFLIPLEKDGKFKHEYDSYSLTTNILELVKSGKLSSNTAKEIYLDLYGKEYSAWPEAIEKYAEDKGYVQNSDEGELGSMVQQVIDDNPNAAEEIKSGQMKVIGFLVGQVMQVSKGKANPGVVQEIIKKKLGV